MSEELAETVKLSHASSQFCSGYSEDRSLLFALNLDLISYASHHHWDNRLTTPHSAFFIKMESHKLFALAGFKL
jgi:hypothetical protein